MAMKQCNNGHYYDTSKHSVCPFCGVQDLDISVTMPIRNPISFDNPASGNAGPGGPAPIEKTVAKGSSVGDNQKTVGIMQKTLGFEPTVGWLVCVKGKSAGKDYRLKSQKNFIGRGNNMDVCIQADSSISRENHAIVSYDPRKNVFTLSPGDGHGLVYLNGSEVNTPTMLKRGDGIELGETILMFVPFCGEDFKWQND